MAEEAERSSSGANLRDLIIKVETERAEKYRNILLQLLPPGEANAIGVSRVLPGGASIYPTSGAPLEQAVGGPPVERGVDRNNRPGVEDGVAIATQSVRALCFPFLLASIDPMAIYGRLRCRPLVVLDSETATGYPRVLAVPQVYHNPLLSEGANRYQEVSLLVLHPPSS